MTVRKILIVAALLVCQPVFGQIVTLIDAVEVSSNNIIVPSTINGTVTFRPCSGECEKDYKRARLTVDTKFSLNGRAVKFDEFRRGFAARQHSDKSFAMVAYNTKTNTITELALGQ